jgi:hypothetical protein
MQSWGTPFAINCGLTYKTEAGTEIKKVRVGAKHPIVVENAKSDDVTPSFEYKNANPLITEIKDTIDWMIKLIAITKGIDPNSFLQDVKATSGFSKVVDSLEEMEMRQDDIEPCRIYENERYMITQKVLEVNKPKGYKEIKGDFICDFAEIVATKSLEEMIKESEFKLKNNLITPIDLLREQNPDLTDEQLEERYNENKEINDKLKVTEPKENKEDFSQTNNSDE